MTDYYVGPGGSDANDGQSWANRKLTLGGAEALSLTGGDNVYVAPGVYRESLSVGNSGSVGNHISYIADLTGEKTDGVGGKVRITGSDNDQTQTRTTCVVATGYDYRTFRGFHMDGASTQQMDLTDCDTWVIEDCCFDLAGLLDNIMVDGSGQNAITIRRCLFLGGQSGNGSVSFEHTATLQGNHIVENCVFIHTRGRNINIVRVGEITVKNCLFIGDGIRVTTAIAGGDTVDVNNCIFFNAGTALRGTTTGEIVEDYNCFYENGTDRNNVNTGANSVSYIPGFNLCSLLSGIKLPQQPFFALHEWSALAAIAGTGEATDDFYGLTRPTTSAKKSWGPIQFADNERDTGTTRGSSTASIKFNDAGRHQIFVPVSNESTTFSVYVNREANYAGTNPQMIIRQPGQADTVVTDTATTGVWNELTTTLTPAAGTDFVVVELVSNNTATSGSYATYFDDLTVS